MKTLCLMLCLLAAPPLFADTVTRNAASEYFETYASRKDFDRLMSFYAEDATFKDILTGIEFDGRDKIAEFLDWHRGEFSVEDGKPALVVTRQVIAGNTAVTEGVFNVFFYDGNRLGPWEFVMWHEFNDQGKITSHHDWINYTPKKILIGIESPED